MSIPVPPNTQQPADAELVRRFKEGDKHAYTEIVRRYQHRVFTQCLRWMGDERIAEEVAQDVFLALFRALQNFRGDSQLSTWIYRVVVNHCKNRRLYRKRRAEDRHEPLEGDMQDDEKPQRQLAADQPDTDALTRKDEAEVLLREGLEKLDEEQRAIIVMRDVDDMAYEEIADILGVPRGTVKSKLHRARAELAKVLSRKLGREDVF
jgi:RNA polymerase sigma-70 factor, ECF subfamily